MMESTPLLAGGVQAEAKDRHRSPSCCCCCCCNRCHADCCHAGYCNQYLRSAYGRARLPSTGAVLVLVWSGLLHCFYYYSLASSLVAIDFYYDHPNRYLPLFLVISSAQVVSLLLYPAAGLAGEVLWSRYKVMIGATVLVIAGLLLYPPSAYYYAVKSNNHSVDDISSFRYGMEGASFVSLVVYQLGMAVFEANAIQLGADQLQFSSTQDFSTFIHWYYWTTQGVYATINCVANTIPNASSSDVISAWQPGVQLVTALLALVMVLCLHRYLIKEPVSLTNPVKVIYRVLRFAQTHKKPLFRSAFTYGESLSSRLDLAKEKYGGPFSFDEVEDTKSFFRILLVIVCCYGFMLAQDENSVLSVRYEWLYSTYNHTSFAYYETLISPTELFFISLIPIYQLLLYPFLRLCLPSMLKRIAIGLTAAALSLTTKAILSWILELSQDTGHSSAAGSGDDSYPVFNSLLLLVPKCLQVMGEILVTLSALEFILAQAPRSMQGLLIGVWYAFTSVSVVTETASFLSAAYSKFSRIHLQYTIKACLAIVSLGLLVCAAICYKPRQRNEPSNINERQIIEEYTERQLNRQRCMTEEQTEPVYYVDDIPADIVR